MGHCPECMKRIEETVTGNTTVDEDAFTSFAKVHECPHCGIILGISEWNAFE